MVACLEVEVEEEDTGRFRAICHSHEWVSEDVYASEEEAEAALETHCDD